MQNIHANARTQRILQHLEEKWQLLEGASPYVLSRVMAFVTELDDSWHKGDRTAGLKPVADYVVGTMGIHMLNMLAIFKEKAEEEGISLEDRDETLNYARPETMRAMEEVSTRLSIQSLDDLAALVNITVRLQVLSRTDSADEAQNWLYELPAMYHRQLTNEGLLGNAGNDSSTTESFTSDFTDWSAYNTGGPETFETGTRMTMPTRTGPLTTPVHVRLVTDTQFNASEA